MSTLAIVGATLPPALRAVLEDRRRTFDVVAEAPPSTADLRGLIVGPDAPADQARDLVAAALEQDVPTLVFGAPASAVLGTLSSTDAPQLRRAVLTEDGTSDDVTAATMPGAPVVVTETVTTASTAATVLLRDEDGGVLLARRGTVHATRWRLDVGLASTPELDAHTSFIVPHAAALLGRWVDIAVGRTDAEQPWGRRGPQPVAAPGLSLNPA